LTLNSDEETKEILKKYEEVLEKEVGAKVEIGEVKGDFKGILEFKDRKIEIGFRKIE